MFVRLGELARQGGVADRLDEALGELGGDRGITHFPDAAPAHITPCSAAPRPPRYDGLIATRKAFGDTSPVGRDLRRRRRARRRGGTSTFTEAEAVAPERFFQLYIAEQCMVGVQTEALGKTALQPRSARS